ncbi:arrestin domain-containing protein 2-like isoform X2 [Amphibalanus amphitrite]|nr:arrestin domain-containing protein 2-like isoform X2 [Amphibalanus amphitrite]
MKKRSNVLSTHGRSIGVLRIVTIIQTMGVQSTNIVCRSDRPGETAFRCGETVNGSVVVTIDGHKSHKFSSMLLKVRVQAKTEWEENDTNYSETQDLFRLDLPLRSATTGETSLPPGQHQLPFSFPLPERLPHTMKYHEAKVVFLLKARLKSSSMWSWDGAQEVKLRILPQRDLSQCFDLAAPLKMLREDKWTMWNGNPGEFSVTVAKQGYVAGETIDLWIDASDGVYTELAQLDGHVKLKRLVVAREGKKNYNEERTSIATVKPGKAASAWHRIQLTVPEDEITMDDLALCRIISVTYYVKVKAL